MVVKIIEYLGFPKEWLSLNVSNLAEDVNYRKRATMPKKVKTGIEYTCRMIGFIID